MNLHYKTLSTFLFSLFTLALFGQSGKNKIVVPNLVGMALSEAKKVLSKSNVSIGAVVTSGEIDLKKDVDSLIVYRQNPNSKSNSTSLNSFKKNKLIDIWVVKNYSMDSLNKPKPVNRKVNNDLR